jgi:protein involved in polysaccharide export with SLBB domain
MAMGVVRRHFICALVSTTVAWPLAACAQQPAGVVPSGNEAYKIGPLDVLDVTVFKVPDLSKTVQVDRNGTITYPLIGEIPAAGKTARELARDLAQRLNAKYLRSPQITITIKSSNTSRPNSVRHCISCSFFASSSPQKDSIEWLLLNRPRNCSR